MIRLLTLSLLLLFSALLPLHADDQPGYVGAQACAGCHAAETAAWKGSHHALAMQPATPATVLGDFSGAQLEHFGVTTTFFRDGDRFLVRTDGPDGKLHEYPIAYTFGVAPLQQYLIEFPNGRYQALGIAWDSRTKEQGGQRWYHLYPDRNLAAGDALHWTGRDQTWNYMCADCHSTNLRKNFDLTANAYATTFTDVNVGCEACHGPGSRHVAWAQAKQAGASLPADLHQGLVAWLDAADRGTWQMDAQTGIAKQTEPSRSTAELDACGACHTRRKVIAQVNTAATPLLDATMPALLDPGLYHADGQIDGEVFEVGSFVQSKMFAAGVTCTNCHDPHAGGLRAAGNALCAQCHAPQKFDVAEHHHHAQGSAGSQCVACHMPAKTYMSVDLRRDHSFRVPRPDLSEKIGVPNTCNACHALRSPAWAAKMVAEWFPDGRQTKPHYGTALHAGRSNSFDAEAQLDALILDRTAPAMARASALPLLAHNATPASQAAVQAAIADPDALVRMAVPRALPADLSPVMLRAVAPLLVDPVRAVRIEAARALAGADPQALTPEQRAAFAKAIAELVTAETVDADRPEAHLNLGLLDVRLARPTDADTEYRTALRLDPDFVPGMVNLADLDRARGLDAQGAELLRKAMALEPDNAAVRHSLGLLLVRQHKYDEALQQLRRASELAPNNTRYAYVYAVALNSTGAQGDAMALLEWTHQQHPTDREVLVALVSMARERNDVPTALRHARELLMLSPGDPQLRLLIAALERQQAR
ncbi:MAG TPA: multiheme c-type cytochrome [Acetobacteraceae bacterium]|nr:multiheme c-type cytochrome [Acetobacteraceae bacterium]